jgi:hypothetical protein
MKLFGLFELTKESLIKWILAALTGLAATLGINKVDPQISAYIVGGLAIVAGIIGTWLANKLHLAPSPVATSSEAPAKN